MIQNKALGLIQNVVIALARNAILYLFVIYTIYNIHNPIIISSMHAYQNSVVNKAFNIIVVSLLVFFKNNATSINCIGCYITGFTDL